MKDKSKLEEGSRVFLKGELAEVSDLCPRNSMVVKVRMLEGRFSGDILIAVLSQLTENR